MKAFVDRLSYAVLVVGLPLLASGEVEVSGVSAVCRHGQTFVTWKDAAEGEAGAAFRYAVYRSDQPIAPGLAGAERCLWTVTDKPDEWSVKLFNALAKADITVDVTPRRCQKFRLRAGERLTWTNSAGGSGAITADAWGLGTVEKVLIKPGAGTTLTIKRAQP
jgi:hypothetical protein